MAYKRICLEAFPYVPTARPCHVYQQRHMDRIRKCIYTVLSVIKINSYLVLWSDKNFLSISETILPLTQLIHEIKLGIILLSRYTRNNAQMRLYVYDMIWYVEACLYAGRGGSELFILSFTENTFCHGGNGSVLEEQESILMHWPDSVDTCVEGRPEGRSID